MAQHPVIQENNVAVITGAADGIGLAIASRLASLGMRVCLADINEDKLQENAASIPGALACTVDVSSAEEVRRLKKRVYQEWGQVDVLINNAGSGFGTTSWTEYDNWQKTLAVNLNGVINGIHTFVPVMLEQGTPGLVINTGSKQGITNPPGDPAYNVTKAAIKALTEQLQHSFRSTEGCQLSAHLLVPGFTYSGLVAQFLPEKPDEAWTCEQVADFMLESLANDDFYILCPDNDATRDKDNKRMAWSMGDLIENRPALSRWHPDFTAAFENYLSGDS